VSAEQDQLASDWAEDCDEIILRRCPVCDRDSIVGYGWRRKQAHDEHHDWIWIHRGRCVDCGMTFTFLLVFSLPYTHYSLLARCQALWQHFVEHCPWEKALPKLKDPIGCPIPPLFAAGRVAWTRPNWLFPSSVRPSPVWLIGWRVVIRPIAKLGHCAG
jgi:hypothetical protein